MRPIEEDGFTLTKNEFRDAIHLSYNKTLNGMPSQNYDVTYVMNCTKGSFIIMRLIMFKILKQIF